MSFFHGSYRCKRRAGWDLRGSSGGRGRSCGEAFSLGAFTKCHHQSGISHSRALALTPEWVVKVLGPHVLWAQAGPPPPGGSPRKQHCGAAGCPVPGTAYLCLDLPPVLFRELVAIRVLQLLQHAAVEGQAAVDL